MTGRVPPIVVVVACAIVGELMTLLTLSESLHTGPERPAKAAPERAGKEDSSIVLSADHRSDQSGGLFSARADRPPTHRDHAFPFPSTALSTLESVPTGRPCWPWRTERCSTELPLARPVSSGGDLVVNTSHSGYQEICTDPSYAGQVVLMTYPLIGNYGRIAWDDQSGRPWLRGLVVAHATAAVLEPARQLVELLRRWDVPAICGSDTRRLARRLRETGSQRVFISAPGEYRRGGAVAAAQRVTPWEDQDFVGQVSVDAPHEIGPADGPLVGVVDYGLKQNIVRSSSRAARGCA